MSIRNMFGFLLAMIFCLACTQAQEVDVSNDKAQCIEKFIEWCNGMKYPEEGTGMTVLSLAYHDDSGYNRVFCSSDSEGSNCTKNGSPWFQCTPDHTLTYKGQVLSDGETDVDDGICATVEKVYNELSLQTFSFDNTTLTNLNRDLGSFFAEIEAMQEQIRELQKRLSSVPFMNDDFWNGFGGEDFFSRRPDASVESNDSQKSTKDTNQIERE